jgi:hypothetical protein
MGNVETIFGIPAHPLLVHAPVVLIPLGALGVVMMLLKKAWFERYKWAVLVVTGAGALGLILAASSGESLQESSDGGRRAIAEHAEAGETARLFGFIFFVIVVAAIALPIVLARMSNGDTPVHAPAWVRPVVGALLIISAGAAVVTVIDAGHSGADSVWNDDDGDGGDDGGGGNDDD